MPAIRAASRFLLPLFWAAGAACAQTASIEWDEARQAIDGFGASTAWHGAISDAEADAAFGNGPNQMGLGILRVRIDPSPLAWPAEKSNAQKAKAHGAKVLATPWTPPPPMKTLNSLVGGELRPDQYPAYAAHLKGFCAALGDVDVVSVQNEPNIKVNYESCAWTGAQIRDFCKSQAAAIGTPVMMPEAFNFDVALSDPALDDSAASAQVAYVGGHLYGGSKPFSYDKAIGAGKRIWMTEYYVNDDNANGMLQLGKQILDCLANGMHAYVYWYLSNPPCNLIRKDGSFLHKGYVMAQFAKFIRPGSHRVEATYQPQPGVYVAAFRGEQMVIVAVNLNASAKSQTFSIGNGRFAGPPRQFTTSLSKSLAEEGAVALSGPSFTISLEAQSITTFVATPSDAVLARPSGRRGCPGCALSIEGYLPTGRRLSLPSGGRSAIPVLSVFEAR
jgi:glucuronoarabinoxylan endo-1,4-beta-xylanase